MIQRHEAGARAQRWWHTLQPDPATGRRGDRAALARLRRCSSVSAAMQDEAALLLFRDLGASGPGDLPGVGLVAAVLAHVREDRPGTVARLVGPDSLEKPETALLKPLRFRRLMEADSPDERLAAFRRLVALTGGTLPVRDLATALLDWNDHRRTRWVYDYWNVARPDATPAAIAPAAAALAAIPTAPIASAEDAMP